jgi:hypothetical protein
LTFETIASGYQNFFVYLHAARTSHEEEMVFWDQNQNQLPKISKIPGLSHEDHNCRSLSFQSFHLSFDFQTSMTQLVLVLGLNCRSRQ